MKLAEINLSINTEYRMTFGVNRFNVICKDGDLYKENETSIGIGLAKLTDLYTLDFLVNDCDFSILWGRLEKDNKILCYEQRWRKRHFKEYKDGKILVYDSGRTSYTDDGSFETYEKQYVKLYKEG